MTQSGFMTNAAWEEVTAHQVRGFGYFLVLWVSVWSPQLTYTVWIVSEHLEPISARQRSLSQLGP
jgi:hypothetical protein